MKYLNLYATLVVSLVSSWLTELPEPHLDNASAAPSQIVACYEPDSNALVSIYQQTALGFPCSAPGTLLNWTLSDPVCEWPGVTLDPSTGRVTSLKISNKKLTGTIPVQIADLTKLVVLEITSNCLTGSIPPQFGNLTDLEVLYIDNNELTGTIPDALCNLINLQVVFMDNNTLTGAIPECFNDLDLVNNLEVFNNCLNEVPDLSGMASVVLGDLKIYNNKLTFDDILPHLEYAWGEYAPQDSICTQSTIQLVTGTTYGLDLGIDADVPNNSYQWYKDGAIFGSPTNSNTLVFNPVSFAAVGVYHCQVTNPDAPDLTLYSRAKTIDVVCGTSVYNFTPDVCDDFEIEFNGDVYNAAFPCGITLPGQPDQFGCDSIISVCLNFVSPATTLLDTTICSGESILLNGNTYDASNTPGTEIIQNQNNCDSLVIEVQLSFFPEAVSNYNTVICKEDSLLLHGQEFHFANPTGQIILDGNSFYGCDSTINVNLNFWPIASNAIEETLCAGESIVVDGTTYDATNPSGIDTLADHSWRGCDSIVNINLTFVDEIISTLDSSICAGHSIMVNGTTYDCNNPSGEEILEGGSFTNCDSTVVIALSCYDPPNGNYNPTLCSNTSIEYNGTIYDSENMEGEENLGPIGFLNCDSIVEVQISFYPPAFTTLDTMLCENESIIVDGQEIENSTVIVMEGDSYRNCDSTVYVVIDHFLATTNLIDDVLCPGSSIVVNGMVYNDSNLTGTEITPNFNGCDSIITIDISYGTAVVNTDNQTLCFGESLTIGNVILNADNPTHTDTLENGSYTGCDSITITNVSFFPEISSNFNPTLCPGESLNINGFIIDENTPISTIVLLNASYQGCDSTIFVDADFWSIPNGNYSTTLCSGESILINGTLYNEDQTSGTETVPNGSFQNCDSTYFVSIDFYPPASSNITSTICEGDQLDIGGNILDVNNPNDTIVLPAASYNGCDSTVYVNLDFYPPASAFVNNTLCFGQSVFVNGTAYNEANPEGTELLENSSYYGCDSTITIALQFNSAVLENNDLVLCDLTEEVIVNGNTYNVDQPNGIDTLMSYTGCDSIVITELVYPDSTILSFNDVLCTGESKILNGTVYNEDMPQGQEVIPGGSPDGCDLYYNINLTFLPQATSFVNQTLCAGENVIINGVLFDESHFKDTLVSNTTSYTGCDSMVIVTVEFYPEIISELNQSLCVGQSLFVNGTEYSATNAEGTEVISQGSYTGCDSTVFIDLNFGGAVVTDISLQLCEGESTAINGTVYDVNNPTGLDTIPFGSYTGCDSVLNVSVSFNSTSYNNINPTLCSGEELLVNGTIYNAINNSGTDTLFSQSYTGCDSILTIAVAYFPLSENVLDTLLCTGDTLEWNGILYNPNISNMSDTVFGGSYTGCDSVVFINIDFHELSFSIYEPQLCPGDEISFNGIVFNEDHLEEEIILEGASYTGCDSVIYVSIVLNPLSNPEMLVVTICEGETYEWNNQIYSEEGNYMDTLAGQSFFGCDSMQTLLLSIETAEELGLSQAGTDFISCGEIVTLSANQPTGTSGLWTIVEGTANIDNTQQAETTTNNSSTGELLLAWTLSTDNCPDYDSDTLLVQAAPLPIAANDDYLPEVGISIVSLNLIENDDLNDISNWYLNILNPPTGDLQDLGDGLFDYMANEDSLGILVVFNYELCNEDCPEVCDTASVRIQLQEFLIDNPKFPNTITTNGDGVNDFFVIPELEENPEQYPNRELVIFNRWGDIVFQVDPYQNDWGGVNQKGKALPQGTYYYLLRLDVGEGIIYKGDITILK